MKVLLYKDTTTDKLYTLSEVKSQYETENNCEIPVDIYTMQSIIYENLACVGGNIEIICNNDPILAWCNAYADYMEADRGMTTEEIESSVRDIYLAILNGDEAMITEIKDNLFDGDELLERLNKLLESEVK